MFHTSHLSTVETLPTLVVGVLWFCFGFWVLLVFGSVFFWLPSLPIFRVSILLMMTWARRPHGVRTRAKKDSGPG